MYFRFFDDIMFTHSGPYGACIMCRRTERIQQPKLLHPFQPDFAQRQTSAIHIMDFVDCASKMKFAMYNCLVGVGGFSVMVRVATRLLSAPSSPPPSATDEDEVGDARRRSIIIISSASSSSISSIRSRSAGELVQC